MTSLADALPEEIERVRAKRDRWIKLSNEHPEMAMGMQLGIALMQHEIGQAAKAISDHDTVQMIASLESLRAYPETD